MNLGEKLEERFSYGFVTIDYWHGSLCLSNMPLFMGSTFAFPLKLSLT